MNPSMCQGGALIDLDTWRLLWFGGDSDWSFPIERTLMQDMMEAAWSGWQVEEVEGELNDFAHHLELSSEDYPDGERGSPEGDQSYGWLRGIAVAQS